jgi:hypothetical protein
MKKNSRTPYDENGKPSTNFRKYISFSPGRNGRHKPPTAGSLNAKTLAEENLRGFALKNLQKSDADLPLRVNCAQRIELPVYFNTPRRKEDIMSQEKLSKV